MPVPGRSGSGPRGDRVRQRPGVGAGPAAPTAAPPPTDAVSSGGFTQAAGSAMAAFRGARSAPPTPAAQPAPGAPGMVDTPAPVDAVPGRSRGIGRTSSGTVTPEFATPGRAVGPQSAAFRSAVLSGFNPRNRTFEESRAAGLEFAPGPPGQRSSLQLNPNVPVNMFGLDPDSARRRASEDPRLQSVMQALAGGGF